MFADGFGWGFAFGMLATLVEQRTGLDRTLWVVADNDFVWVGLPGRVRFVGAFRRRRPTTTMASAK
jgi:hypothetical protein